MRRVAAADWVITTPGKLVKDIGLYHAITWRRVIVDEAHQLSAPLAALAKVPCSHGRWCVTAAPLESFHSERRVQCMDRIFAFLHTGFSATDMSVFQAECALTVLADCFGNGLMPQVRNCCMLSRGGASAHTPARPSFGCPIIFVALMRCV